MKSLAVIGSSGMLGSDLVRYLSNDYRITKINRGNYSAYTGKHFDIIVNANGNSKRFWANKYPLKDFTASTVSVYKTLFDFSYKKYIYISSSDVYEKHSQLSFTKENQFINPVRLSPYGFHKYTGEIIVKRYANDYIILRSSLILGNNLKKGPFFDIINNAPLFISKRSKLQIISTEEISRIIHFFIKQGTSCEIFNVGGKGLFSFSSIGKYFKGSVVFNKKAEVQIYETNTSKLEKEYTVAESEEYVERFFKNYVK